MVNRYGSGYGNLSMGIANHFPGGTVLSLEPDKAKAKEHWRTIVGGDGPYNNIVGHLDAGPDVARKLAESPEFLRYQYISWGHLQWLIMKKQITREQFNSMLGAVLSTAASTFIKVPSAQIISLLCSTFFPDGLGVTPRGLIRSFEGNVHPTKPFLAAEKRLIAESARTISSKANVTLQAR